MPPRHPGMPMPPRPPPFMHGGPPSSMMGGPPMNMPSMNAPPKPLFPSAIQVGQMWGSVATVIGGPQSKSEYFTKTLFPQQLELFDRVLWFAWLGNLLWIDEINTNVNDFF